MSKYRMLYSLNRILYPHTLGFVIISNIFSQRTSIVHYLLMSCYSIIIACIVISALNKMTVNLFLVWYIICKAMLKWSVIQRASCSADRKMEVIPKDPILEFQPDTLMAIRKIYNLESQGRMGQSVDILEDWIKKQEHFLNKNFSRGYLERTIISCKGSVEKSKLQIDKLCTLKTLLPKFFISSDIKNECADVNKISFVVPLPKMTKDYQRIFLIKIGGQEFKSSHFLDYCKLNLIIAEYLNAHDYVNGFIIIEDLREANLMDLITKINVVEYQQFMTILMEGYGAKMKGIYIISQSKVVDLFVKILKTVLSPKLAERVHIQSDIEELHQIVDKELLPIDFGGKERSVTQLQAEWMEVLGSEENEKYLAEMKASYTDESLRQTDKFNEQHMGLPGSFRTLTVD